MFMQLKKWVLNKNLFHLLNIMEAVLLLLLVAVSNFILMKFSY